MIVQIFLPIRGGNFCIGCFPLFGSCLLRVADMLLCLDQEKTTSGYPKY